MIEALWHSVTHLKGVNKTLARLGPHLLAKMPDRCTQLFSTEIYRRMV